MEIIDFGLTKGGGLAVEMFSQKIADVNRSTMRISVARKDIFRTWRKQVMGMVRRISRSTIGGCGRWTRRMIGQWRWVSTKDPATATDSRGWALVSRKTVQFDRLDLKDGETAKLLLSAVGKDQKAILNGEVLYEGAGPSGVSISL